MGLYQKKVLSPSNQQYTTITLWWYYPDDL